MAYANAKKFFGDDKIHVFAGVIVKEPDQEKHYFVNEEGYYVISVEMHHHGTLVRANLSTSPGVWVIPDVGTEVLVATDNGEFEGELYLIGTHPIMSAVDPSLAADIAPQNVNVIVTGNINLICGDGAKVMIAHTPGNATAVPTIADINAIWQYLMNQFDPATGHHHTVVGGATTTLTESVVHGTGASVPEPGGTTILRAE